MCLSHSYFFRYTSCIHQGLIHHDVFVKMAPLKPFLNQRPMNVAINTLEYARLLIDAGVEQKQAEAHALTLDKTLNHALKDQIATKADVENIKIEVNAKIERLDSKIDSTRWVLGMILAVNLVMLGVMLSKFY